MPSFRLSRRAVLRGAGACLALPMLEAMLPMRGAAQPAAPKRFFALFYPNGRDPGKWDPAPGPLNPASLPESLRDLGGFAAEGIWPRGDAILPHTTVVSGINHSAVAHEIHIPCMSLMAHKPGPAGAADTTAPSLDQFIAAQIAGNTAFRTLTLSATPSTDIAQGNISWRAAGQVETVERDPARLFQRLFSKSVGANTGADAPLRMRQSALLDHVREDAKRLHARLGSADRMRLDQYLTSVSELQRQTMTSPAQGCQTPNAPTAAKDWHAKAKLFIDLAVLALACDLSRVVTLQYSDSWGVHYSGYTLGTGKEALGTWSDHFISHKLGDKDRATDLDGLDPNEARRIADARVVQTARFKVRRFAYLVNALKSISTPTGTLLDETLAMYCSENGDGDSHSRDNMGYLLAGGGMAHQRSLAAKGAPTGALHAAILSKFGMNASSHGNPAAAPLPGL